MLWSNAVGTQATRSLVLRAWACLECKIKIKNFRKGQLISGFPKHLETHPNVVGLVTQVTTEDEGHSQLLKNI